MKLVREMTARGYERYYKDAIEQLRKTSSAVLSVAVALPAS